MPQDGLACRGSPCSILYLFQSSFNDMYKHFFKRVIDFTIALLALLIIWPVLAVVAVWQSC